MDLLNNFQTETAIFCRFAFVNYFMNFTNFETLKNILGITEDAHGEILQNVIQQVNNLIISKVWDISYKKYLERVDANGNNKIYLKRKSDEILSVIFEEKNISVDFVDGYIILLKNHLPKKKKSVLVEYMAGYKEAPAELAEIATTIAKEFIAENFSEITKNEAVLPNKIKQKQLGDLSITYFSNSEMNKNNKNIILGLNDSVEMEKIFDKYRDFTWLHT